MFKRKGKHSGFGQDPRVRNQRDPTMRITAMGQGKYTTR